MSMRATRNTMFGIILALAASAGASLAQTQTCTLKEFGSLDMTFLPDGNVSVPIGIGGKLRNMIVDLSDNSSSITPKLANELGLRPISRWPFAQFFIYFHDAVVDTVVLPEVQVANISTKNVGVWLLPDPNEGSALPPNVDGAIGSILLGRFDLDFDFANKKLNLFSRDHCAGSSVVYWADSAAAVPFVEYWDGALAVDMQLDGKPVEVGLTTIERDNTMMLSTMKKLFGIDVNSPGLTVAARDQDGEPTAYRYPLKSLAMPGISIANPEIDVLAPQAVEIAQGPGRNVPSQHAHALKFWLRTGDMQMGLAELRKFHLFVAFHERMIYLTLADAHK